MLARLTHDPLAWDIGQPLLTLPSLNNWFDLILIWFWFACNLAAVYLEHVKIWRLAGQPTCYTSSSTKLKFKLKVCRALFLYILTISPTSSLLNLSLGKRIRTDKSSNISHSIWVVEFRNHPAKQTVSWSTPLRSRFTCLGCRGRMTPVFPDIPYKGIH